MIMAERGKRVRLIAPIAHYEEVSLLGVAN
jgi:hypothetical protein